MSRITIGTIIMISLSLYQLLVVMAKKSLLQLKLKVRKVRKPLQVLPTLAIVAVTLILTIEHKKAAKEPSITIISGQSLTPLVGPVSTPEIRMKALKISDTFEHAKEIQTLFRAFHEIWRTLRQRAVDISLLQSVTDGTTLLPKDQTIEDVANKITASEAARVKMENKKVELLAIFYIEERETKKQVIKEIKQAIRAFEKMASGNSPSKKPKVKKVGQKLTLENQVNSIMSIPEPEEETNKSKKTKLGPSKNKSLSRILEYSYHESIIDIKFIGKMITLYAQSMFQKVLNKALYAAINPIKMIKANAKNAKVKNFIPEEKKLLINMAVEKVYNLLLANNSVQSEAIKEYKLNYKKASTK